MSNIRISQKDIARLAGVSQGTVSAVLNDQKRGNTKVSEATRLRILEIAAKHNYRPNQQARQLRGLADSNLVGVFVNEKISPLFYNLLIALEREFQERQLQLIIGVMGDCEEKNRATLIDFSTFNLAGIICLYHDFSGAYDLLLDKHSLFKKILFLDPADFPAAVSGVEINYAQGIRRAVRHLAQQGKKRIALFQRDLDFTGMKERLRGYREGLAEIGQEFSPDLVFIHPDYIEIRDKADLAIDQLVMAHGADAVITGNDEWAIALMKQLTRRKIAIPEQVAVIGFANYDNLCLSCTPELTAVQYDCAGISQAFVELLHNPETEEFSAAVRIAVDSVLAVRESSQTTSI